MAHDQEWSEVVATTNRDWIKGAADNTRRERIVFAMMQRRNRIRYRATGTELRFQLKFALPETQVYEGGALDFEPSDKHRQLWFDWRGYVSTDKMDEKEYLMNRGPAALIRRYERIAPDMRQAMLDRFDGEIFNDGNTNTDRMHGLETFLSDDNNTVAADKIARPDSTYGGYSCTPGAIAGNWTSNLSAPPNATIGTDWPSGTGDPEYDWLSPKLINVSSTSWGTGDTTFEANGERCIRQAIAWTRLTGGRAGKLDLILLCDDYWVEYGNAAAAAKRIQVGPTQEVVELGFPEGYRQEGVSIMTEFGVPANTGYGLNIDQMRLHCMYDDLFDSKGPKYDVTTLSWLWVLAFFGNWQWNPKYFVKFYPYA